jgi:hypothetical protein
MKSNSLSVVTSSEAVPVPYWWLRDNDHVIAGALVVRDDFNVEAQILLDGLPLYRSRHTTRAVAEEELAALRGQCTREGWQETV